ncbi:MAG TPA: HAD-IA family hydrolase, partial [Anaerolineales bacterium]|nr:HAD-IA family hydrolase [Anaerolineales bacterium]
MIDAFDIGEYISCISCADDDIQSKPAPDMVLALCELMSVKPSMAMVIGDTMSDLKMAHAAGAGLAIGALSGVSSTKDLAELADTLIESVDELNEFVLAFSEDKSKQPSRGLNPDFAF